MSLLGAFAARVDGWVDAFCAACDAPWLAYERIVNPPKPPTLVGPPETGPRSARHWVPSKRRLLQTVRLLEYFHGVRGTRQSVSLAELERAAEAGGHRWLLLNSLVGGCNFLQEYRRRIGQGLPRQRYVRLVVRYPWKALADVIDVLGRGEAGGADVDLVERAVYSLCPEFRKVLPRGLRSLRDLLAAFPGTFEVSSEGRVRCLAAFDDPRPESEIATCHRHDVHTREDLEGIVSLARAAAGYPGVKTGSGIPLEALHAWGRKRYPAIPCWQNIGSFRRFLYAFRKSGYYRLAEEKVLSHGRRGAGCRIEAIRTVIRVVGEADGFADCETVADIVNRWVPGFGGRLDKAGFVRYVRNLKGGDFVLAGDRRIADRLAAHNLQGHVACRYYARCLAKQKALGEGLAFLWGHAEKGAGVSRYR